MNDLPSDYSPCGILTIIENASQIYEDLAEEWQPGYETRRAPLLQWIDQARASITQS
jgi:hypothetical protein